MPRIRTIKPDFWVDEKLAPCSPLVRLTFLGLISLADDAGRLLDNVKTLDGQLFPETDDSCREPLEELAYAGRILRYTTPGGQRVIQVTNWAKHQKVDHPNRNVLPPPPRESFPIPEEDPREVVANHSRESRAWRGEGEEGSGTGEGDRRAPAHVHEAEFSTGAGENLPPPPPDESLRDENSSSAADAVLDALVTAGVPAAAREGERPLVQRLLATWPAATLRAAALALPRHRVVASQGKAVGAYLLGWDGMIGECLQIDGDAPAARQDPEAEALSDPAVSAWLERVTARAKAERDPTLAEALYQLRQRSEADVAELPGANRWSKRRRRERVDLRVAKWYGLKVGDPMPTGPSG